MKTSEHEKQLSWVWESPKNGLLEIAAIAPNTYQFQFLEIKNKSAEIVKLISKDGYKYYCLSDCYYSYNGIVIEIQLNVITIKDHSTDEVLDALVKVGSIVREANRNR